MVANSLLIVDDEIYSVEIIKSQMDWASLGIDRIYQAYSIKHALRVFEENTVDILICDVEMGNQSGLDLLKWVKDHRPQTVSLVFSGYARFEYCQRAIELGSISYMLKPVEYERLRENIQMALDVFRKRSDDMRRREQSENIRKNSQKLLTQFWSDVVSGTIPARDDAISEEARKMGVPLAPGDRYMLVFAHWRHREPQSAQARSTIRHALVRQVEQHLVGYVATVSAIVNSDNYYIVRQISQDAQDARRRVAESCESIQGNAARTLGVELKFCIGMFESPGRLHGQFAQIYRQFLRMDSDRINLFDTAQDAQADAPNQPYSRPDIQMWEMLLETGKSAAVRQMAHAYLSEGVRTGMLNDANIVSFQWDFYHMVHALAERSHLESSCLKSGEQGWILSDRAGIENDINHKLNWLGEQLGAEAADSLHDRAKAFVAEHLLDGDLSRQSIADYLNVNPEYLSRIFKKRESVSLVEYIQTQKIAVACKLLNQTDLRISEIAARLGYSNFAYFTQVFKRETGMTPAVFRKKWTVEQEEENERKRAVAE